MSVIGLCIISLWAAGGLAVHRALADQTDPELLQRLLDLPEITSPEMKPPVIEATGLSRVAAVVVRASEAGGGNLLPGGSTLVRAEVDDRGILNVDVGCPPGSQPRLDAEEIQTLERAFVLAWGDDSLAGIRLRLGVGEGALLPVSAYGPPPFLPPPDNPVSDDTGTTAEQARQRALEVMQAPPDKQSPEQANSASQPAGALSGVVVFVAAGHGWTDRSPAWFLQRGLLLNMIEDYGNIDQLSIFVRRLYQAGAVVVPYRPVGDQPIEIVLDNDDPGVTYTGSWTNSTTTTGYYENGVTVSGVPYRYASTSTSVTATARYRPTITTPGFYPVYAWTKDDVDRVNQRYHIAHGGGMTTVSVDHRRVGRGWVWLGEYYFEAGTAGYVEIDNQSSLSGIVVADAIRFGNGMGDVVGAGSGVISGYPRSEEAQRYWAEGEGGLRAVGLPASIWDCCTTDQSDNVGAAARWAAYMNRNDVNNDRWRRVYIEFHSNAAGCGQPTCSAKGTVALVNSSNPTTNQMQFSTIVGDRIEADMLLIHDQFEYTWGVRSNPISGEYGAISTVNNGNEFDATLVEVAFHDNVEDAANLRNIHVRDAVARSTLHGLITFLSNPTIFPGTTVPAVFPPEPPTRFRVVHEGQGQVRLSWAAGPSGGAYGSPATGYRIYRSDNGYGFGRPVDVGNVLTAVLTDIPAETVHFLRVAAVNAGGESVPGEVLAVRWSAVRPQSDVLVVNGFDRVSRQQNHLQQIPQGIFERQLPRRVNSFDYVVQHAFALAACGLTFDSTANEAVAEGAMSLSGYAGLVWILGEESDRHKTFNSAEQSAVTAYLSAGGSLFVSGAELAYDLDHLNNGRAFFENTLGGDYLGDDGGTYQAVGVGGVFSTLGTIDFSTAAGAPYDVDLPDRIAPRSGATSILRYVGGTNDSAAIQYDSGTYRTIVMGIPFEAIGTASQRAALMQRAMPWLLEGRIRCQQVVLTDFEPFAPGTMAMFQKPRFSNTTVTHLSATPDLAEVYALPGIGGQRVVAVQWDWVDAAVPRWLRLTTFNASQLPNPTVDIDRPLRFFLRFSPGSLRVCAGLRETHTSAALGADGGTTGPIEWVGATSVVSGIPHGRLLENRGGIWQAVTIVPTAGRVHPFTGNGVLEGTHRKAVLEHIAFTAVDDPGPITLYLDMFRQLCPLNADLDGDQDVDLSDIGTLQACLSGAGIAHPTGCGTSDLDADGDVDADDLDMMLQCLSGAGIQADPACLE